MINLNLKPFDEKTSKWFKEKLSLETSLAAFEEVVQLHVTRENIEESILLLDLLEDFKKQINPRITVDQFITLILLELSSRYYDNEIGLMLGL